MSLCSARPSLRTRFLLAIGSDRRRRLSVGCGLGVLASGAAVLAGCAISPPLLPNGLPRVSRYTNSAQVEFLLSSYSAAANAQQGQQAGQQDLLDEACLGWERAVFDLQSAQRYPMLLRMSTESANLAAIWHDLPALAQRNPRPESCGAEGGGSESPEGHEPQRSKSPTPVPTDALPREALLGQAAPAPGNPAAAPSPAAPAASPPADGAAPVVQAPAPILPPPAAVAVVGTAQPESKAGLERRELLQLRRALGMPAAPAFHFAQTFADPTVPQPVAEIPRSSTVDVAALQALAQSEIPTVRLRARFHLLGLCTLAVEASDHFGEALPQTKAQRSATTTTDKLAATDGAICAIAGSPGAPSVPGMPGMPGIQGAQESRGAAPGSLRQGQRRQLASLLKAWRAKYTEPMTDMVVALANFVSRDNPVVDGPRITR